MFCSNCGADVKDGVKFCSGCGASVQATAEQVQPPVSKLPMAEYLAMNTDYQQYKKKYDRGHNLLRMGYFFILLAICGLAIYVGLRGSFLASVGILIIGFVAAMFIVHSLRDKAKRKLEDYGAQLYKQYLSE